MTKQTQTIRPTRGGSYVRDPGTGALRAATASGGDERTGTAADEAKSAPAARRTARKGA